MDAEDPTGTLVEPIDPMTGNRMPARLLIPDPGWNTNQAAETWTPSLDGYEGELRDILEASIGPVLERLRG